MATPLDNLTIALADRYTLERGVGAGGMATVYLAHDVRHNRKVAIKVLRPEVAAIIGAERFLKEIETTANLQHPNILPLFDSGQVEGTVFYVMPYLAGESLRARLVREVQLPIADAIRIAGDIAAGLDYAHRQGVIHRDIKPDNVLFHDGRAMVADFGIALAASRSSGGARITRTGMSLGTPEYMSPEQAAGEPVDSRTDVYALGAVVYEMVTGEPPFTGPNAQAIVARVMNEEPRPASQGRKTVPGHVEAAIARALEKLPADRWRTAVEFSEALATPSRGSTRRRPVVRRGAVALLGLGAAAALALAWVDLRGGRSAPPSPGPVRFGVELDPGTEPTFTPIVKLSADGRNLFLTANVRRQEEILHRPLGQMRTRTIAGAGLGEQGTGNNRPFLSPNGRWIAFAAQGKLRKVPVEGGPAIDLGPAEWAGGSWGKDGRIVYTLSYNTGLSLVSEGGGDVRVLTTADTAKGELGHWWPQILPDGDHVLFTAYRTPIERATIEVLSIQTGERKVLLTGGVYGLYVPTGHLLYAAGETIRAVPFDLGRLAVTGAAIPVVDSVAMNPSDGAAAFDVSANGTLAYLPVSSYTSDVEVVLVDRRGKEMPALPAADRYQHPRLSPDGSRIAVDIRSANSLGDVWVFQKGRPSGTRLTSGGGRDWAAEWTPDGQELIYISEQPYFDLYRRVADASRPAAPLLTGGHDHYTGTVSEDGRLIAYGLSVSGASELWTVQLHGDPAPTRYLANGFNLSHPSLSPDGRWMAYDSDESGRPEVYVQSFPDPSDRRWKVSSTSGSEPLWTRGGRELVFRKGDSVMAVSIDLASGPSGQPVALFGGPYPDSPGWTRPRSYDVSRDGERFLLLKLPPGRERPRVNVVLNWFEELRAKVPE
jgi:eukaryotic-like serine/threonine-protein kinase